MEVIVMSEKYFTDEQQEWLRQRREIVGEERIRQVEQHEWPTLIAEVKGVMAKGTDPADATVQELARRWKGLVEEFTSGNPGITQGVARQYKEQSPNPAQRHGMALTREVFEYIGRAMRS
jgi:hypothetical protein